MLLPSILVGYKIDWVYVMVEHINESALRMNILLSFPIFIHRLCNEARVYVSFHIDLHIEALHTMDFSLINADKNLVALREQLLLLFLSHSLKSHLSRSLIQLPLVLL